MKRVGLVILLFVTLSFALPASASPVMSEYFSSAPNYFGSPSWAGYLANALVGIQNGGAATGNPNLPTYYQSGTVFSEGQLIVTDYNSWDGQTNPTGAFAAEDGNRLHVGVFIDGNGTQVSLSELTFNYNSNDPSDALAFSGGFDGSDHRDDYSMTRVGIIHNVSGPDTLVTSGSANQLVDELVYVGVGNAFCSGNAVDCGSPFYSIGDLESYMNNVNGDGPFNVTNTYALVNGNQTLASVTATATITTTPEPGSMLLLATGLLGVGRFVRRKVVG